MTATSEENIRLSVVEAKIDGVATAVGQTHDRISQVETRISQLESRMDAQFQEFREGQRQIFLAIKTTGTVVTMVLVGLITTLAFRIV